MVSRSLEIMLAIGVAVSSSTVLGQPHGHQHGPPADDQVVERPKIFFDKSPRIVAYQLSRLSNQRLLLVNRSTNDPKYIPAYRAILTRDGIPMEHRHAALQSLTVMTSLSVTAELIDTLESMRLKEHDAPRTARQLATLLLTQPVDQLSDQKPAFLAAAESDTEFVRSVAYAALIATRQIDWSIANKDDMSKISWLRAVSLLESPDTAAQVRDFVVELVETHESAAVRVAAIRALAHVGTQRENRENTVRLLAPLVAERALTDQSVRTLLTFGNDVYNVRNAQHIVSNLVARAEATPAAERTTDPFIDAMQLADRLLTKLPVDEARSYRQRLRDVAVRVIRIHTVEEEMRYDLPYFAVEAGRQVQLILQNEDLMPHNLVLTTPGSLQTVAKLGLVAGPVGGQDGKQYVPRSELVLHATPMVQPRQRAALTFAAPETAGEYPYVCTFPNHWMRMYGVMVVVKDLESWLQNPVEPKDPVGSNRPFVQSWTINDLAPELVQGMRGRQPEIGRRIFEEATCLQCHRVRKEGGAVGPELTDVFERWKGDTNGILREIIDPSHRIDPKYAMVSVITLDGNTITGIIQEQNDETLALITDPAAGKPIMIETSEIDEVVPSSISMMPKALLDRFTKDEVFELLAYLKSESN